MAQLAYKRISFHYILSSLSSLPPPNYVYHIISPASLCLCENHHQMTMTNRRGPFTVPRIRMRLCELSYFRYYSRPSRYWVLYAEHFRDMFGQHCKLYIYICVFQMRIDLARPGNRSAIIFCVVCRHILLYIETKTMMREGGGRD